MNQDTLLNVCMTYSASAAIGVFFCIVMLAHGCDDMPWWIKLFITFTLTTWSASMAYILYTLGYHLFS